jgi:flagellin
MAVKGVLVGAENIQAAESLIRDTDMATQMVEFVKDTILVQSGTAMLAQANLQPKSVLQLLG